MAGKVVKKRTTALLEKATSFVAGFAPGQTRYDKRLPAREPIVGIHFDGAARAYPLDDVQQAGIIEELFNGKNIRVEYDAKRNLVRVFADGSPIIAQRTWWLGWYEFHPQTTIFTT